MGRLEYLVDTSALTRFSKPAVAEVFEPLAAAGRVGLCSPVIYELGHSAENPNAYASLREKCGAYPRVPVNDADLERSLEIQAEFVRQGRHRQLSLVDAVVAAVAEVRGLTILHYDADFENAAEITGQRQQWIVPRGTAD